MYVWGYKKKVIESMNSSTLSLHRYNGSLLTEEEISLSKYYENKKNSFYNEEEVWMYVYTINNTIILSIITRIYCVKDNC